MPKEFCKWMSDMSGTIPDKSTFITPSHNQAPLTDLQKRLHIADLLVSDISTENKIHNWVMTFCVSYRTGTLSSDSFSSIVGAEISKDYYTTESYSSTNAWLNNFRQNVLLGRIK